MKLTKQLLKEMILKEMSTMNEANLDSANLANDVKTVIDSFKQAQGATQVAFITAEEPPGAGTNFEWDNTEMQKYLVMDLNGKGYDFYPIEGDYGSLENSLFVVVQGEPRPNFYDDMVRLGKKYNQDAVIVGKKQQSMQMARDAQGQLLPGPAHSMEFEMINLHPTKMGQPNMDPRDQSIYDTRDQVQSGPSIQSRQQFYSKAGNFKFVIPFFSSAAADQPEFKPSVRNIGE